MGLKERKLDKQKKRAIREWYLSKVFLPIASAPQMALFKFLSKEWVVPVSDSSM
jgi:hypothetical protein